MKKILISIGIVVVLLLAVTFVIPLINNSKEKKLLNDPEYKDLMNERAVESFDTIIAKYQLALDYPSNMLNILNLGIYDVDGCMSDYNKNSGDCSVQYAYYDLNHDNIDELIIANDHGYEDVVITDIYYYDNNSAKLLLGGFYNRNYLTIYENGKFASHGSGGACCGIDEYYGNMDSIGKDVIDWTDLGIVLQYEYDVDQGKYSYSKFDKNYKQTNISEKKFNELIESYSNRVDYSKWNWVEMKPNPEVIIDDKYKATDYFYLTDKNRFVKGKVSIGGLQTNYTAYELATSYPKLYELVTQMGYDVTYCRKQGKVCEINLNTYEYPMKYMEEVKDIYSPVVWHYIVTSTIELYYDSDGDGYVDSISKYGYRIAPIDEYNKNFGELVD